MPDAASHPEPASADPAEGAARIPVALSTSSCFPASCEDAFALAKRLGYDGLEIMVWTEKATQDAATLNRLSERYGLPVLSIHAPTLLLTQYLWGADPWVKIDRSVEIARGVGASTVVVHPPFRWQREYALGFIDGIARREQETGVRIAVENMFPWRSGMEIPAYLPDWDPTDEPYASLCLDLSHAATAGDDFLAMLQRAGDRCAVLHLGDGLGSFKDEHLVPGRGHQPCAETLRRLAARGWTGTVVLEVNTRGGGEAGREADLAEALVFARTHLGQPPADAAAARLAVLRGHAVHAKKAGKKAKKAAKRKDKRQDKAPRTPERHARTKAKSARVRAKSERAAAAKKLRKDEKAARRAKKASRAQD